MSWLDDWSPWRQRDRADRIERLLLRIQDEDFNRESKLREDLRLADECKDQARRERDEACEERDAANIRSQSVSEQMEELRDAFEAERKARRQKNLRQSQKHAKELKALHEELASALATLSRVRTEAGYRIHNAEGGALEKRAPLERELRKVNAWLADALSERDALRTQLDAATRQVEEPDHCGEQSTMESEQ